ncbi:alpha/beta fold hydrolase [Bradyrhizobium sp. BWA-3-5]|uniref:alpha/beta fold hydrolase n=1 Tax=Bradyrhizobium sp. BWA-3-5 TaxID=3080013 RepID=UPI00293EB43B|nr:alpha/beta fold hydrolase [Bradyrhizobium sp. BWA-3-5]WOH66840.1 alpha/beta fold hydrolase [Bradyrhizobium sp. BWA-3-5]
MSEETRTTKQQAGADWAQQAWLWPLEATRIALDSYARWFASDKPASAPDPAPLAWTTENAVALQLASMRLREFSAAAGSAQQPLLICAPYALHGALVADFAPGHSVVEALQQGGTHRIYVTDWCSATPDMRYLSIDNYLADLNVAVDEIGVPVDLVGLCQGGWLSLTYAARFPDKVRRLVLAGAPVDVSTPSELSKMVAALPPAAFAQMVQQGEGIVSGEHMLRIWNMPFSQQDVEAVLQRTLGNRSDEVQLLKRFMRWDRATLDLPGSYYLDVTERIFRQNQIANGRFVALGRTIDPTELRVPVFLLAGDDDIVVPRDQAFATGRLLGTQPSWLERACEPCGHLSLFMGRKVLSHSWRRIARWLQADIGDVGGVRIRA